MAAMISSDSFPLKAKPATTSSRQLATSDAFLPSAAFDSFHSPPASQHLHQHHHHHQPFAVSNINISNNSHNPNNPAIISPQSPNGFPPSAYHDLRFSPTGQHLPTSNSNTLNRFRSNPNTKHQHQQPHYPPNSASHYFSTTPPDLSISNNAAHLYRSISADATNPPSNTHVNSTATPNHALVQRLAQQNASIRDAWEAERNYLEANRRRAEEVYQEERVIMEEVREGWENEKAALLRENQILKERIQRLEGENATLRAVASHGVQATGVMSPLASQRGGSTDASVESGPAGHPLSQLSSQQGITPVADPSSLPPGLDGASRRPHHVLSPGSGSRTSPLGQPESSPFIPLDPRMQPQTDNPRDFLGRQDKENMDAVPVIDIQEVDPKLEGIALKATAVQRYTFGESSKTSPATSPPTATDSAQPVRGSLVKRNSSKDQTIQVLQAHETRRLTMHAGHTPNHSLSLFPTMSLAGSTGAATQEDDGAASVDASTAPPEHGDDEGTENTAPSSQDRGKETLDVAEVTEIVSAPAPQAPEPEEEPEEQFVPDDDFKLKGPLMVKNIPAQDEIFWDQVNKKLEPISLGQDALPSVMRSCDDDAGPSGAQQHHAQPMATVGGDAQHDAKSTLEDQSENVSGEKGVEGDVPLKLRSTTNFGAPFGVA